MIYTLKNEALTVLISSLGGELQSISSKDGLEYLWQGDPKSWNRHAPNLFPYIGRLTNGQYTYHGQVYQLNQHGFLRNTELTFVSHTDTQLVLSFTDTPETKENYPFSFHFTLTYTLKGASLTATYKIKNTSEETMYFGLGGHPGFNVPIDETLSFEDYSLAFEEGVTPKQTLLSENYFISEEVVSYPLYNNSQIPLTHDLFDHDAIILSEAGHTVSIQSNRSDHSILFDFSDFNYVGLWQTPKSNATFLCIEPWSSLPSKEGVLTDLETQDNLIALPSGEICQKEWSIQIN